MAYLILTILSIIVPIAAFADNAVIAQTVQSVGFYVTYAAIMGATITPTGLLIFAALSLASALMSPKQEEQQANSSAASPKGRKYPVRSSMEPHRIIYGKSRVSGPLVFAGATNDNQYLWMVYALAGHEVESIDEVYFNEELAFDASGNVQSNVKGFAKIWKYTGTDTQKANNDLIEAFKNTETPWTSDHTLSGVAYLVTRLKWGTDRRATFTSKSTELQIELDRHGYEIGDEVELNFENNNYADGVFRVTSLGITTTTGSYTVTDDGAELTVSMAGHGLSVGSNVSINGDNYTVTAIINANSFKVANWLSFTAGASITATSEAENVFNVENTIGASNTNRENLTCVEFSRAFPSGIPNVSAIVKGKKVYDPRTGVSLYSDNAALCIRDYLVSDYGLNCDLSEIDDDNFISQAAICDETVSVYNRDGDTENQKRYTVNGTLSVADNISDNVQQMLTSCAGIVTYTMGQFKLFTGAYVSPYNNFTITEDDIVSELEIQSKPTRSQVFNSIKTSYVDPDLDWELTDAPIYSNSYYTDEDGETLVKDYVLPMVIDPARAQRLARLYLEQSRQSIVVQCKVKLKGVELQIWDRVYLQVGHLGWSDLNGGLGKIFVVTSWRFSEDGAVDLLLQEDALGIYTWDKDNHQTQVDLAPNTTLPDFRNIGAPAEITFSETIYNTTNSSGVKVRVDIRWFASNDAQVRQYEVQFKKRDETTYKPLSVTQGTSASIFDTKPASNNVAEFIDVRIRSIGYFGQTSDWVFAGYQVLGLTEPPAAPANFQIDAIGSIARLTWDRATDLDVLIGGKVEVRHSPVLSGATWARSTPFPGPDIPGSSTQATFPLVSGTYLAKFFDSAGNGSPNATSIITNIPTLQGLNVAEQLQEQPDFTGEKIRLEVDSGVLQIAGANLVDDFSFIDGLGTWDIQGTYGTIDSVDVNFDSVDFPIDNWGEIFYADNAEYIPLTTVDLGTATSCRLSYDLEQLGFSIVDLFDFYPAGYFDSVVSETNLFDGQQVDTSYVIPYFRYSVDGLNYEGWKKFAPTEVKARLFQFKLKFYNADPFNNNVQISKFEVNVDMPDRIIRFDDLSSNSGSDTVVSFNPVFYTDNPSVAIAAQNMQSGDYYTITGKDKNGFTINFYNSSSVRQSRTFDVVAAGY